MIVLGFDTATPATAVGLMLSDGEVLEARDDPGAGERPGHSTRLLPLVRELLLRAGLRWDDLERIAVGVGPGTFTGLRIGLATARGLTQSLGAELVGVSSLQALAHAAFEGGPEAVPRSEDARDATAPRTPAGALAVIDARRGEAFAAAYGPERELVGPRALAPERLGEIVQLAHAAGPSRSWVAVGDGALRFADVLRDLGLQLPPADSPLHRISGAAICALGARVPAHRHGAPPQIVPDYGRPPDAVLALQGAD